MRGGLTAAGATFQARPWTSGKTTPVWQSRGRRIRWRVIWTFFGSICRSLLPLIGWATNGLGLRDEEYFSWDCKSWGWVTSPALYPLYLWNAHDRVKWDEEKYVPDKFTNTFTWNVQTFRHLPQTFLCSLQDQERVHCRVWKGKINTCRFVQQIHNEFSSYSLFLLGNWLEGKIKLKESSSDGHRVVDVLLVVVHLREYHRSESEGRIFICSSWGSSWQHFESYVKVQPRCDGQNI